MTTATLTASDTEVSDALKAEIDAIKVHSGTENGSKVEYKPQAWTREGRVD